MKAKHIYTVPAQTLREGVRLHAAQQHQFRVRPHQAAMLEVEDVLFHLNSAVLMPSEHLRPEDGDAVEGLKRGLGVLYVVFQLCQKYEGYRLLIAGHTDTSGEPVHNLKLSEARAAGIYYLLKGHRERWTALCEEWHRVEDVQRLLHYFVGKHVDPGPVDNQMGPKTRASVRFFQAFYNETRSRIGYGERPEISVDGAIGPQTWGAFFDNYQFQLACMLGCTPVGDIMDEWRAGINAVDPQQPFIGLGESFPIDEAERDNYRSAKNRRVEMLLFGPEDIPAIPSHKPPGGTYEAGDCPFYDKSQYVFGSVEVDEFFAHTLEFETVDEEGHPVPNQDVVLFPLVGGRIDATSDDEGYCIVEDLPPGRVTVALDEKTPAAIRVGTRYVVAQLVPQPAEASEQDRAITCVVVHLTLSDEERERRNLGRSIYGRLPSEERPALPGDAGTAPEAGGEESGGAAAGEDASPCPSPTAQRDEHVFYAHDNLALVAGRRALRRNEPYRPELLHEVVHEYMIDYHGAAAANGFNLMVIDTEAVYCLGQSGEVLHAFPIEVELAGTIGAYTLYATPGDALFRDMTYMNRVIVQKGREHEFFEVRDIIPSDGLEELQQYIESQHGRTPVVYFAPTSSELTWLAAYGGAGFLETYGGEKEHQERIHDRNREAVEYSTLAYRRYLMWYIEQVNATPNPESLQALGPPRSPYRFPTPFGLEPDDDRAIELARANNASEFQAWKAINDHLNSLAGRRSAGLFLNVELTFESGIGKKFKPGGEDGVVAAEIYQNAELKTNLTLAPNGFLTKSSRTIKTGGKISADATRDDERRGGKRGAKGEVGVEHRLDVETGEDKTFITAMAEARVGRRGAIGGGGEREFGGDDWKAYAQVFVHKMELASNGDVKYTYGFLDPKGEELGAGLFVEYKPSETVVGAGGTIDFGNWKDRSLNDLKSKMSDAQKEAFKDWFEQAERVNLPKSLTVGLYYQGIREDTLLAYFSQAPGFFERRTLNCLLHPGTTWNHLTSQEKYHLEVLGWKQSTWDFKHDPAEAEFPPSTGKDGSELSAKEQVALVHLGFHYDQWKPIWAKMKRRTQAQ